MHLTISIYHIFIINELASKILWVHEAKISWMFCTKCKMTNFIHIR